MNKQLDISKIQDHNIVDAIDKLNKIKYNVSHCDPNQKHAQLSCIKNNFNKITQGLNQWPESRLHLD